MINDKNKKKVIRKIDNELNEVLGLIDFLLGNGDFKRGLEDLKTTLTLSLGTKKKLDKLNSEHLSYDVLINNLIREVETLNKILKEMRNTAVHEMDSESIYVNLLQYKRKIKVFKWMNYNVTYSYNQYVINEDDFEFALKIDSVRYKGEPIPLKDYHLRFARMSSNFNNNDLEINAVYGEIVVYFTLLDHLIKETFSIKSTRISKDKIFEPIYWEFVLSKLKLPGKVIPNDIREKAQDFDVILMKKKEDARKNG